MPAVHSLPQFGSFAQLARDFGMTMGVQAGRDRVGTGAQWCTMGRAFPYGVGSQSWLLEVFLVVVAGTDVAFFSACPRTRRIVDCHGRSESGEPSRRLSGGGLLCGKHIRRIDDSPPLIAFHCLNHTERGSQVLTGYRFRIELHVDAETQNKRDLQRYVQEHHTAMHPAILPAYFKALVAAAKKSDDERPGPARFHPVTNKFTNAIFAYHAAVEKATQPCGSSLADFPDLAAALAASAEGQQRPQTAAEAEAWRRRDNPLDRLPTDGQFLMQAAEQFGSTVHSAVPADDPVAGFPVSTSVGEVEAAAAVVEAEAAAAAAEAAAVEAAVAAVERVENPLDAPDALVAADEDASAAAAAAAAARNDSFGVEFIDSLFAGRSAAEAAAPRPWAIASEPSAAAAGRQEEVSCSSASAFGTPVSEGLPPTTMSAAAAVPAAETAGRGGGGGGGLSLDELFGTPEVTAAAQPSQKKQAQQAAWESFSDAPFQS